MSYPEPRYLGAHGEVSAVLRPADQPPDLGLAGDGPGVHYLATGATTGGEFGLYRWNMAAAPSGAAPHFHRTMSESFFVLSGEVNVHDGAGWHAASPGDFLYVPPGGVHGFRNDSGAPATMLILFTPGAPREPYFETLAAIAAGKVTLSEEERTAFLEEHDNHFV